MNVLITKIKWTKELCLNNNLPAEINLEIDDDIWDMMEGNEKEQIDYEISESFVFVPFSYKWEVVA